MASAGDGEEFSLVPQWLKTSSHAHQAPSSGTGSHAAGAPRDSWHSSRSSASSSTRPTADPSLRPSSLSAAPAGIPSTSANGGSSSLSSSLPRGADRDRDRDRAGHAAWGHFHTSGRSTRAGNGAPGGRESASGGHSSSFDGDCSDRFQPLGGHSGSFKPGGVHSSSGSSGNHSRHGLQRSVSDSGGAAASSADAVHSGSSFGHHTPQQPRERERERQDSSRHHTLLADDKLGWRDSNHRDSRQQYGPGAGRAGNKPPPLTSTDFPSLALANSMTGSSPRSSSSDRLGSPQPYAPSVAPYKQDFLASRGSLSWTSKLADVPGASGMSSSTAAAATAGGGGGGGSGAGGTKAHVEAAGVKEPPAAAAAEPADAGAASSSGRAPGRRSGSSSSGDGGSNGSAAADRSSSRGPAASTPAAAAAAAVVSPQSGVTAAGLPSLGPTGAAAGTAGGSAPAGASLADTLKQAVAASNGAGNGSSAAAAAAARAEAQRRQSKALVPLVPGSKTKHGAGSGKGEGRGSGALRRLTPALAAATAAAGAAATGAGSTAAAAAKLLSPTSPVPLLKLGAHAAGSSGNARDGEALHGAGAGAAAGAAAGILSPVSPTSVAAAVQAVSGSSDGTHKAGGVAGPTAANSNSQQQQQQQQHLSDRHSFFAVLKRKSTNHHSSNANGSSGGGSSGSDAAGSGGGRTPAAADSHTDAACAADGGSPSTQDPAPVIDQTTSSSTATSSNGSEDAAGAKPGDAPQQQQQQPARLASHSLVDVLDTISSSGSSDGGCDRTSLSGSSVTSDKPAQDHQQQQQGLSQVDARGSQRQHSSAAAEPAGAASPVPDAKTGTAAAACGAAATELHQSLDIGVNSWEGLEKDEEAFLRSLGWTSSDDEGDEGSWGLTQEEIAAFQAAAAAAAAHSHAQQQQQQQGEQVQVLAAADSKLQAGPPGSLYRGRPGGLFGCARLGPSGGLWGGRGVVVGEGVCWPQHQSLPNGFGAQAPAWGLTHTYWPPALTAAHIFGGDSSSEEESDSERAE